MQYILQAESLRGRAYLLADQMTEKIEKFKILFKEIN